MGTKLLVLLLVTVTIGCTMQKRDVGDVTMKRDIQAENGKEFSKKQMQGLETSVKLLILQNSKCQNNGFLSIFLISVFPFIFFILMAIVGYSIHLYLYPISE